MSKLSFSVSILLLTLALSVTVSASSITDKSRNQSIVITSETLTADSKNNTATFEGSVLAKSSDISMHSDKMTVTYDSDARKVIKIHAVGDVKVNKDERALFSDEAIYIDDEKKIIFTGNAKAVDGKNIIAGKKIVFYIEDDRAVVEGSRVVLQNTKGIESIKGLK